MRRIGLGYHGAKAALQLSGITKRGQARFVPEGVNRGYVYRFGESTHGLPVLFTKTKLTLFPKTVVTITAIITWLMGFHEA